MNRLRLPALTTAALAAALVLSGCSGTATAPSTASSTPSATATSSATGELTVYAAASLSGAFAKISDAFSAENPGVTVKPITYDGSSTLATQIIAGAPVDVFASADTKNMDKVAQAGMAGDAPVFTTNALQIAVEPGNPHKVTGLESLSDPALKVVLCAPAVPCGNAAKTLLDDAGVTVTPVSEEQNVTAVLTKVKSGDANAGLVYTTDVKAAGSAITGITIPTADKAVNSYPITVLKGAPNPKAAEAFVTFVRSDAGQKILKDFGFGAK
ncbi:molybdate ABC transporter substrate-binding protein [uncultured Microbacterium sp.]|uniref:molybdate ABC transporter substrate-binding protein n=1 Tax=uncultured Microbacterium sp. TaxID=191216 RepID=UPI0025DF3F05|nr:molybdate ABC transporter substrate-binding protein [uncultured Microbacterium sp.]